MLRPYMACEGVESCAQRAISESVDDHVLEGHYIRLKENQNANEGSERDAVKENVTKNVAFVAVPLRRGAGHDDALRVDHFSHHAAGAVRRAH